MCILAAMDAVRLLHRDSTHGYTDNPARAVVGEAEAVSAEYQLEVSARSHRQARQARAAELLEHRLELERHIAWLYSQRKRGDVRSQMRAAARALERLGAELDL